MIYNSVGFATVFILIFFCFLTNIEKVNAQVQIDSTKIDKWLYMVKSTMLSSPDSTLLVVGNIYDTTLNLDIKATCSQVLGIIYKQKGQYEMALTYYLEAYDLFKKTENKKGEAFACNNIGTVYFNIKNYDDARIYLNKSIDIKINMGLQKELSSTYINIANIFMKLRQFDSSIFYFNRSLKIAEKFHDYKNIFSSYLNLGETEYEKKEYMEAFEFYKKALKFAKEEIQIATCMNAMAKAKIKLGCINESKRYLEKALTTALKLGNRPLESKVYENYSKLYESQNDFENSLIYLKKYQILKDTLMNSETTVRMQNIKTQYKMQLKDEQIALLNKDVAIKDAEKETALIIKNSLIIAFIFILLISIILYKNVKTKQKTNFVLQEKNNQIGIHQQEIEQKNLELDDYNKELMKENISAKYEILKNKINPHFLFNSLSTLSSLVMVDQMKALEFVSNFSKLYRDILELGNHTFVKLEVELNFAENYLKLQKFRFSDNLIIKKEIDKKLLSYMLPPFSLQLVLENALKHNMISKENNLEILIYTEGENIIVSNNLQKRINTQTSTGIGQKSIIERYKMFTDKEPIFEERKDVYIVIIPLINQNKI